MQEVPPLCNMILGKAIKTTVPTKGLLMVGTRFINLRNIEKTNPYFRNLSCRLAGNAAEAEQ